MIRRALLALIALAWLPLAGASSAQVHDRRADDMAIGRADAPVTVIEYASVTCPHCARWHTQVFPEFKRRYVDTGQVRFIFREMPNGPVEVATAGFMLARCAPEGRYFDVIGRLMRDQPSILQRPWDGLVAVANDFGLTEAQFEACLNDERRAAAFNERVEYAFGRGVQSTPTFFVNGRNIGSGELSLAQLDAAIQPHLGR